MKSNREKRESIIKKIIEQIEKKFIGVIVVWRNTGTYGDDFKDDTEVFEAYMVKEEIFDKFTDFVWKMADTYAYPNGFSIMVHDLTPEETREYRWSEYQAAIDARCRILKPEQVNIGWQSNGEDWKPLYRVDYSLREEQIIGAPAREVA